MMKSGYSLSHNFVIYDLEDIIAIVLPERWGKDHFSVPHKTCMNNVILALSQSFTFAFHLSERRLVVTKHSGAFSEAETLLMLGVTMHYGQGTAKGSTFQRRRSS